MDRRAFLATLTSGLLAAPLAAKGERAGRIARVGLLVPTAPIPATARLGITQDLPLRLREPGGLRARASLLKPALPTIDLIAYRASPPIWCA